MIVYIESNFILEMVLGQTQAPSAVHVLQLAESNKIELAFPSFALSEPFATITRRERDQERLSKSLAGMLDQLPSMLANAAKRERDNLWSTVYRLVNIGTSIETNADCLNLALEYQRRFLLTLQDSIIYAAIITDLRHRPFTETKCFMNKNYKDFEIAAIIAELNSLNCRYERSFGKGLSFIRGCL
jgi:predicted nucleic acid-binding protein